jgi:4-diphosphocytidyl-2-C-methyl-D-erythritol kinase
MTRPGAPDPLAVYPAFHAGPDAVVVAAPAKINLFLEVLRRRADGYHDLESLMVAVDLFDTLEVRADLAGVISLECDPPGLPNGPENLVVKAAHALRESAKRPDLGAAIRLTKRIPTQAGLAGGSSDAALALLALNEIWKLAQTRDELAVMGSSSGSDVAFFLSPPAGWCTGRGEVVTPEPVPAGRPLDFVLVCPAAGLGTPEVYRALAVPAAPVPGDSLRAAVRAGDAAAVGRAAFNRLEEPAFALAPLVRQSRDRLAALAPCGARMSGSGSAVFAVCRSRNEATDLAAAFRKGRPAGEPESRVFVVRSLAP